ncbi:MAG: hypothetical protein ACHQ7M_00730 [Chloroflexota bacterium]
MYLGGRPLCYEHYLQNLNELNHLGLTPRSLTEGKNSMNGTEPVERRIREPARPPERERASRSDG